MNNIIADNGGVTETGRAFIERLYKKVLGKNPSDEIQWATHSALACARVFGAKVQVSNQAATRVGGDAGTASNYKSTLENNLAKLAGGTQTSTLPSLQEGASAGAYKVTTAFDDNIYASILQSGAAGVSTLQATTKIEAGAGYDTLYVDMGNSFDGFNATNVGISGVEKIILTNTTRNENISFNALGIKDVYIL